MDSDEGWEFIIPERVPLPLGRRTVRPPVEPICPACCTPVDIAEGGRIGPHKDADGRLCPMGAGGPGWTEQDSRDAVAGRSGGICEFCQMCSARDMHHRKSRGVGGPWTPANLLHLCRGCHRRATEHPAWARGFGLVIWRRDDPAKIPVIRENMTRFQPSDDVTTRGPRG